MAKHEEKTAKKKGISSLLVKLTVAVAAVYLVVSFVSGQLTLAAKQRELNEILAKVAVAEEKNLEMKRMMEGDDEAAYVERMAREQLGYARPDEIVFVDLTGE